MLTTKQIAKIRQKDAMLTDSLKRDELTNYREGWFFVTLNTRDEVPVLSTCVGNPSIADGQPGAPRCMYTELGKGVIEAWRRMSVICNTVDVGPCEAMPEHFHGLLHLLPGNRRHLGSLISGFMSGCTHAYWDTLGIEWRQDRQLRIDVHNSGDRRAYAQLPPDRDADHTHSLRGPALFVRGYNDVEPLTDEQVQIKRDYIRDQARKRLIKGSHHQCFRIMRGGHTPSWTQDVVTGALMADPVLARDRLRLHDAMVLVMERLNIQPTTCQPLLMPVLDYLGHRDIMANPKKLPLVCHRADAWQFDRQRDAVMKAARDGAVIVSAFISPKEREIRERLMVELLPFVEIMDNGFSDRYKPVGKAFYAVAENRLVQISPWQYAYERDARVTRQMCMVMNHLARVISGKADDWWKV